MGLPETLKGVRLGGCRFTARGGRGSDANLGVSAHGLARTLPRPAAAPHTTLMRGAARLPGALTRKP